MISNIDIKKMYLDSAGFTLYINNVVKLVTQAFSFSSLFVITELFPTVDQAMTSALCATV